MATSHVDVLVVGAGVSGIGIACHLRRQDPSRTIAILERRDAIGGTWDLFRYPGIRCDSDMYTFGYAFQPWPSDEVITDGDTIRSYVRDTAVSHGVDRDIRFGHRVERASWSSDEARWTVHAVDEATGRPATFTCRMLVGCTGYYDYDTGHAPTFPGQDRFEGRLVHPQFWPDDLDHRGQRVVVIGSGATAVTLIPAMAEEAAHVTMLQRSPTYIVSIPQVDALSRQLRRVLPDDLVSDVTRVRNVGLQLLLFHACRQFPGPARWLILEAVRRQVGPDVPIRHFSPDYRPWDQRLCVVPDGDLFRTLRHGDASIVTDHVESFTETGIQLRSGDHLGADVIVTATGLRIQLLGGMQLDVDGDPVDASERMTYKGMMLEDVPNFALVFGYANVSWTRKVDVVGAYLARLLALMDRRGTTAVTPRADGVAHSDDAFVDLMAGYVERARDQFPQQGAHAPWRNTGDMIRDWLASRLTPIDDGHLEFTDGAPAAGGGLGLARAVDTAAHVARTPLRLATRLLAS